MGAKVVPAMTADSEWQGFKFSTFQELDYASSKNERTHPKSSSLNPASRASGGSSSRGSLLDSILNLYIMNMLMCHPSLSRGLM